jgi:hypothetical protein
MPGGRNGARGDGVRDGAGCRAAAADSGVWELWNEAIRDT